MKRWLQSVLLVVCCCLFLWAADFWNQKPYTEWKWHEINKMLGSSPWAVQQGFGERRTLSEESARQQEEVSREPLTKGVNEDVEVPSIVARQYFIRLQSAAPIRMALAQRAVLEGRLSQEQAADYVEIHPATGYIVVAVLVPRTQDRAELNLVGTEYLKSRAYLRLKKSKKRIYLEAYSSPAEMGGWEAYLYFPRYSGEDDLFQLEEEEFTFVCEFSSETRLSRRFNLSRMIFHGDLEI